MMRDLWGVTPKRLNEEFTGEQVRELLKAESGWHDDAPETKPQEPGVERVSGDQMLMILAGMN